MPLPICARPCRPVSRPVSTFQSSYAPIQVCCFICVLATKGPASIDVCSSSPVRSRKPVLMNTTRSEAARIHSLRLTVVRRSSSIIPTFMVLRGKLSASSTRPNSSVVNATSSGPCIFGLTMLIEPVVEFLTLLLPLRSWMAIMAVTMPSIIPSGISEPSSNKIAGLVIR